MRSEDNNGFVAREGLPFIVPAFLLATLAAALYVFLEPLPFAVAAAVLYVLTLGMIAFFRNPERHPPDGDDLIISPADGRVLHVIETEDEQWEAGPCIKVSIFMSVANVHVNRAPVTGQVIRTRYVPGRFLVASLDKASTDNERSGLTLRDDQGRELTVVQIAGLVARRIVSYPVEGDRLQQGHRYGLIRFGSRLELYLPRGTEIKVQAGDRTRAGETIVGVLPEPGSADA